MSSKYPPDSTSPRLVAKAATLSQIVLPNSGGTSVTAGSAAYGSWAQVVASSAAEYYIVGAHFVTNHSGGTGVYDYLLDIGTGGSGSETVLATESAGYAWTASGTAYGVLDFRLTVPLRVPVSSRIAVRAYGPSGSITLSGWLKAVVYTAVEGN